VRSLPIPIPKTSHITLQIKSVIQTKKEIDREKKNQYCTPYQIYLEAIVNIIKKIKKLKLKNKEIKK
jgi:phage terminase small subunit